MAENAKESTESVEKSGAAENQSTTRVEVEAEIIENDKSENQQNTVTDPSKVDETESQQTTTAEVVISEDDHATNESASDTEDPDDKTNIAISIELPDDKKSSKETSQKEDFHDAVREQIENCKFEIISAVQESTHKEIDDLMNRQIRKLQRRHSAGSLARNIIILILAVLVGYMGYCLYDVKYFDFMKSECERNNTCNETSVQSVAESEAVKDTAWYVQRYGSLLNSLKTNLNADKVNAYYLYSNDLKVSEIQPSYLLSMAYNHLNSSTTYDSEQGIVIPSDDLRKAFINLFGSADYYVRRNFTNGCGDFKYDKDSDTFIAQTIQCADNSNREIIEEVTEAYEEGNVIYFLTVATIYDKTENSFYTFDDLFKPAFANVDKSDLTKHQGALNQYQYRFKKVDGKYYFSDIIKLK